MCLYSLAKGLFLVKASTFYQKAQKFCEVVFLATRMFGEEFRCFLLLLFSFLQFRWDQINREVLSAGLEHFLQQRKLKSGRSHVVSRVGVSVVSEILTLLLQWHLSRGKCRLFLILASTLKIKRKARI